MGNSGQAGGMSLTAGAMTSDCPECGCAGSVRLDACQVCYAEVGERNSALFWDMRLDEWIFDTDFPTPASGLRSQRRT